MELRTSRGESRLDTTARQRRDALLQRCTRVKIKRTDRGAHLFRSVRSLVTTSSSMYAKINDLRAPCSWGERGRRRACTAGTSGTGLCLAAPGEGAAKARPGATQRAIARARVPSKGGADAALPVEASCTVAKLRSRCNAHAQARGTAPASIPLHRSARHAQPPGFQSFPEHGTRSPRVQA